VATLSLNTSDAIEFKNMRPDVPSNDAPVVLVQVGEWAMGKTAEAGIIVDAYGTDTYAPILTANDARKLAKWLNRAADTLDSAVSAPKKNKKRSHYEEDDEPYKF
jgi:hypothetical protein